MDWVTGEPKQGEYQRRLEEEDGGWRSVGGAGFPIALYPASSASMSASITQLAGREWFGADLQ